jgi:hypothetical protein
MKKLVITFGLIILITSFPNTVMTQTSRSTDVGVSIVKGITITETTPLHFGTMSIPTSQVDVILTTSNSRISSSPSSINLLSQAPLSENATYTVAGSDATTYTISLPENGTVSISSGSDHMNVVDFIAHPASSGVDALTGTLNNSGIDSFNVGATLKLNNSQPFGIYSGTFGITVNYN